jgi:hypothetical protein
MSSMQFVPFPSSILVLFGLCYSILFPALGQTPQGSLKNNINYTSYLDKEIKFLARAINEYDCDQYTKTYILFKDSPAKVSLTRAELKKLQFDVADVDIIEEDIGYCIKALSVILTSIDPKFDPEKVEPGWYAVPSSNLYPPGVDPSFVRDTTERKAYEAAVISKKNYINYVNIESNKRDILRAITRDYAKYLSDKYIKKTQLACAKVIVLLGNSEAGKNIAVYLEQQITK